MKQIIRQGMIVVGKFRGNLGRLKQNTLESVLLGPWRKRKKNKGTEVDRDRKKLGKLPGSSAGAKEQRSNQEQSG